MTSSRLPLSSSALALGLAAGVVAATPAQAASLTIPVQCEIGAETLLSWDDVAYDLQGTCGVVRITADDATVTMPAATHLVVEGSGTSITAKSLLAVEVSGAGSHLVTPSIKTLALTGSGSTVEAAGLVESAVLEGTDYALSADTLNQVKMRGSGTVAARKAWRTRITGTGNVAQLRRAVKVVVLGDHNDVLVERGRTTVRDRGEGNVLDLRPRKHR